MGILEQLTGGLAILLILCGGTLFFVAIDRVMHESNRSEADMDSDDDTSNRF